MTDMKSPVLVEFDNGIAFVTLNRPEKRNAMNPALNARMLEVLDELEGTTVAACSSFAAPVNPGRPAWISRNISATMTASRAMRR